MKTNELINLLKVFYNLNKTEQIKMIQGFELAAKEERKNIIKEIMGD